MSSLPSVKFDDCGHGGRCNLCNVVFTSPENAIQHRLGKKHKKRQQQMEITAIVQSLSLGEAARTHSSLHGINKTVDFTLDKTMQTTPLQNNQWAGKSTGLEKAFADRAAQNVPLSRHSSLNKTLSTELDEPLSSAAASIDKTVWHTCKICNKNLNSAKQLDIHLAHHSVSTNEMPSANNPLHWHTSDKSSLLAMSLKPNITQLAVAPSRGEAARTHSLSLHDSSNEKLLTMSMDASQPVSSAVASIDKTVWHTCTICNKKLNSAKQLGIHLAHHDASAQEMPSANDPFYWPISDKFVRSTTDLKATIKKPTSAKPSPVDAFTYSVDLPMFQWPNGASHWKPE